MIRPRPGRPYLAGAPMLVAHRGGSLIAPENTLVAFRSAVETWWADMLEMDAHLTRDGQVVVIHDPTVDRTTDGTGRVADLTLREIQALDAGYRFLDGAGAYPFRGKGAVVPTLEEVLVAFPNVWVNVECKCPEVARPVAADHDPKLAHAALPMIGRRLDTSRHRPKQARHGCGAARPRRLHADACC